MVKRARALLMAQNLMERALEVLDDVGEADPAIHLQRALDVLTRAPIPRNAAEAEAMLGTEAAGALLAKFTQAPDTSVKAASDTHSRGAIDLAATMVRLHADKALGRTRMQLYEALRRGDCQQIDRLSGACAILMQDGYA